MNFFKTIFALCLCVGLATTGTVKAGLISAADFETIRVEYNGVITSSPAENIMLVLPGGERVAYTGPAPDYPFKAGDAIAISFDAVVPSRAAIDRGLVPQSVDGIYQFELGPGLRDSNDIIFDFPNLGALGNFAGNGGIGQAFDSVGRPEYNSAGGLAIVYDANSDSYSINSNFKNRDLSNPQTDSFGIGLFDAPVLVYDDLSNSFSTSLLSSLGSGNTAWTGLGGGKGRIPIANAGGSQIRNSQLNLFFDGAFNLPFFNANPPTDVPDPPALILFGAGFAMLAWRRRKKST